MEVTCTAIAENLFESEVFGHVRGAFTGAVRDKAGKFELADGGTLFLDEIGELSATAQSKLLRFLEDKVIERVGDNKPIRLDVRIIAATNRDLAAMMKSGTFREDLYYRLNVFECTVPPLRERPEDIEPLAAKLLRSASAKYGTPPTLSQAARQALLRYGWPGNVRELRNVMERVAAAAVGVLNFIIGIIVMAYVLMSRDHFVGQGKKLLFALCRKRTTCDRILKHLRVINRIFTNFVSGKLLDSLIIGLLCAACLAILRIPYAGLISTIVGITNIIPVFGPFFGAIPSAFLLLLTDPYKCLVFLIFIVILQQVDGNIIGPKILGDSTGLSAFWVLFSLLLFNHLMGFWGMLLGVPLFASFYYLLREFINSRLKKKGLPLATQDYVHVAGIDENGTISYMPPPSIEFHPLLRGSNSLRAKIAQWLKHPTPPHRKSRDDTDRPDDRPHPRR
mgnify:CR=1 FL=1